LLVSVTITDVGSYTRIKLRVQKCLTDFHVLDYNLKTIVNKTRLGTKLVRPSSVVRIFSVG